MRTSLPGTFFKFIVVGLELARGERRQKTQLISANQLTERHLVGQERERERETTKSCVTDSNNQRADNLISAVKQKFSMGFKQTAHFLYLETGPFLALLPSLSLPPMVVNFLAKSSIESLLSQTSPYFSQYNKKSEATKLIRLMAEKALFCLRPKADNNAYKRIPKSLLEESARTQVRDRTEERNWIESNRIESAG